MRDCSRRAFLMWLPTYDIDSKVHSASPGTRHGCMFRPRQASGASRSPSTRSRTTYSPSPQRGASSVPNQLSEGTFCSERCSDRHRGTFVRRRCEELMRLCPEKVIDIMRKMEFYFDKQYQRKCGGWYYPRCQISFWTAQPTHLDLRPCVPPRGRGWRPSCGSLRSAI